MANMTGVGGVVKAGSPLAAVAEVQGWSLEESGTMHECSSQGDTHKEYKVGQVDCTLSLDLWYDPTSTPQQAFTVGAQLAVELYAGGETGEEKYTGTVCVATRGLEVPKDGMVARRITAQGPVTAATIV